MSGIDRFTSSSRLASDSSYSSTYVSDRFHHHTLITPSSHPPTPSYSPILLPPHRQMSTHPDKNQGASGALEASQRVNAVRGACTLLTWPGGGSGSKGGCRGHRDLLFPPQSRFRSKSR